MATALDSNACQNETKEMLIALDMIYNHCLLMTFSDGNNPEISGRYQPNNQQESELISSSNCDSIVIPLIFNFIIFSIASISVPRN